MFAKTEREVTRVREELRGERNCCIAVEDKFVTTLEDVVNRKVAKTLERAHIEAEVEKERILEGALEAATTKYLAYDAFEIVKADCFWEGFENIRDLATEEFLNLDFSFIKPDEGSVEAEEGQKGADQEEGGEVVAEGAVKEIGDVV